MEGGPGRSEFFGGAGEALDHIGVPAGGQIPWNFIQAAKAEYDRRSGAAPNHHIGTVTEAVVQVSRRTLDGSAEAT